MVKHTQTIRRQQPMYCLSMFEHFVGLELKGLKLLSDFIKILNLWCSSSHLCSQDSNSDGGGSDTEIQIS